MENQILTTDRLRQSVLYYAMIGLSCTTLLSAFMQHFPLSSLICILIMPIVSIAVCLFSKTGKRFLIGVMILQTVVLAVNVFFLLK